MKLPVKLLILGVSLTAMIILQGCPAPRPDKEIQLAKEKLELAQREEAPIFSKDEYQVAEKNFAEATNLVERGKNEEARTKALTSVTNSEIAILKTRKKKSEDLLNKLDSLLKESIDLKMNIVSPREYQTFSNSYQLSLALHNSTNYYESITNSRETLNKLEPTVKELRDKWNTARTELNRAITRAERVKRAARWLVEEVKEIEDTISQAKSLLNEAKLDISIQKSRYANQKLDELSTKLKERNIKEMENVENRLRELKINKTKPTFLHFSKNVDPTVLEKTELRLSLLYQESPPSKPQEKKDITNMSDKELENYRSSLESETLSLKEKIKTLYSQAQEDFNKGNYEDSLEKLEKVNELLDIYSLKASELNLVLKEIDRRKLKEVRVTQPERKYTVKKGDFLSKIAGILFNGGYWWWPKIFVANKEKIKDPDLIEVNTELSIPQIPSE